MSQTKVPKITASPNSSSILEQLELDITALTNEPKPNQLISLRLDEKKEIIECDQAAASMLGIANPNSHFPQDCSSFSLKQLAKVTKLLDSLFESGSDNDEAFLRLELPVKGSQVPFCLSFELSASNQQAKEIVCKVEPILSQAATDQSTTRANNDVLELWSMDNESRCFKSVPVTGTTPNNNGNDNQPAIHLDDWVSRVCDGDKNNFREGISKLLGGESDNFHMRYQYKNSNGELEWVSTTARRNQGSDSNKVQPSIVGLHRNESEKSNIVDDLRLFSYLAKKVQLAILVTDKNGKTTWCNNAFTEVTGYSPEEMESTAPGEILYGPLSDVEAIHHMEERIQRGKAFHCELINYKKNGVPFWARIDANPLVNENGELISYISFVTDITESKKTQSAILRSEIKFRSLFDNSIDVLLLVSPKDGVIIESNRAATDFFGTRRLVGQRLEDIFPESQVFRIDQLNEMVADTNATRRETGEFIRENGIRQPVEMTVNRTPIGEAIALFVTLRDISEKRLLEEQLRHAQRMEAVGRLSGGIAHDFNNLLAGLRGFSELLCNSHDLTKRDHVYSNEILKITDRASKLTSRLLSFSRGKSDKPVVANLNAIVGDLTPMLSRILKKDIRFTSKLDPSLNNIKVDPAQIEQVVMNLVVNGQEAINTSEGFVTLDTRTMELTGEEIFVTGKPKAGQYATVTVRDNGQGIPPDVMKKIFEPFFTTKKGAGTGLGLSIVYGIIQSNGGHLMAKSEVGSGTEFSFYFPTVSEAIAVEEPVEQLLPPPSLPTTLEETRTVLIAEDQDQVREILELGLSQCGYNLLVASNGKQAIELAKNHSGKIDMLMTDSIMPGASGSQVIAEIRKAYPEITVIMMSGLPQEDSNGPEVDAYVDKPFSIRKLINLTESFLRRER